MQLRKKVSDTALNTITEQIGQLFELESQSPATRREKIKRNLDGSGAGLGCHQ